MANIHPYASRDEAPAYFSNEPEKLDTPEPATRMALNQTAFLLHLARPTPLPHTLRLI